VLVVQVGVVLAERRRQVGEVVLFLDYDSAQDLADRELAHGVGLADAGAVVEDRLPLVLKVEPDDVLGLLRELDRLRHQGGLPVKIVDLLRDQDRVAQLLGGVLLQLPGDVLELGALDRLAVDDIGDDGLVLPGEVLVQEADHFFAGDR
jgi:hypothetical protein